MQIEPKSDYALTDEACKVATGQTLSHWIAAIEGRPELNGKRRETVNMWLYPEMGKNIWWATTAWVEFERRNEILQKDGQIEGYNICVTKKIAAPLGGRRELVWRLAQPGSGQIHRRREWQPSGCPKGARK